MAYFFVFVAVNS